ncbi:MAG: hypothetical protein PHD74_10485, partial [Candidatus Krumholzibacteria bacterium]|nr:hypothetical protein [Candidatus Krumholzibacteria bacterium]
MSRPSVERRVRSIALVRDVRFAVPRSPRLTSPVPWTTVRFNSRALIRWLFWIGVPTRRLAVVRRSGAGRWILLDTSLPLLFT